MRIHNLFCIFSFAALLITGLTSCDNRKPLAKYGAEVEHVLRNDSCTFRGFDLGDSQEKVMQMEAGDAIDADHYYLYYEYGLPDSSLTYNIAYDFNEEGLAEIQSDFFVRDAAMTDSVFSRFERYFNDHFGQSRQHAGFYVWTVASGEFGNVHINLSDESAELTADGSPGKIGLWIYPEKE